MPIRKRCNHCGEVIKGGAKRNSYCTKCDDKIFASNRKRKAEQYNHQWRKTSKAFRAQYPLCAVCLIRDGVNTPVELADHIFPLSDDMTGYPYANPNCFEALSPLCHRHHVKKTILVDREYFKGNLEPLKEFKQMVELAKEMMQ
jgi:hypothetical protein